MPAGYGNDNDGSNHGENVDSVNFTTIWKIYLFYFFKVVTEGRGMRAEA